MIILAKYPSEPWSANNLDLDDTNENITNVAWHSDFINGCIQNIYHQQESYNLVQFMLDFLRRKYISHHQMMFF